MTSRIVGNERQADQGRLADPADAKWAEATACSASRSSTAPRRGCAQHLRRRELARPTRPPRETTDAERLRGLPDGPGRDLHDHARRRPATSTATRNQMSQIDQKVGQEGRDFTTMSYDVARQADVDGHHAHAGQPSAATSATHGLEGGARSPRSTAPNVGLLRTATPAPAGDDGRTVDRLFPFRELLRLLHRRLRYSHPTRCRDDRRHRTTSHDQSRNPARRPRRPGRSAAARDCPPAAVQHPRRSATAPATRPHRRAEFTVYATCASRTVLDGPCAEPGLHAATMTAWPTPRLRGAARRRRRDDTGSRSRARCSTRACRSARTHLPRDKRRSPTRGDRPTSLRQHATRKASRQVTRSTATGTTGTTTTCTTHDHRLHQSTA